MSVVKILEKDHISPPAGPFPSPGDIIPLSFFDSLYVALPHSQMLLLYPHYNDNISLLKSSLSETLLNFHSLTGKLVFLPSTGDVVLDCRREANNGVLFIEAECEMLSIDHLANDPIPNVDVFEKLVPSIENEVLPVPLTAVQVTRFKRGGVAIGVANHHTTVDGKGLWTFIRAWASQCKGDIVTDKGIINDRAALINQVGREDVGRKFVRQLAPALPIIKDKSNPVSEETSMHDHLQPAQRTILISTRKIEKLKQQIMKNTAYAELFQTPPSRYVVATSLLWVCFARVRQDISPNDISTFAIPFDCRPYLDPPVPENFIGNCVKCSDAKIKWEKLQSENGLVNACIQITKAIKEGKDDVLKGYEGWDKQMFVPSSVNYFVVGLGTGIKAYETDFGWGKPKRVEQVNLGGNVIACMFENEDRDIKVSVVLTSEVMDEFVKEFDELSSGIVESPSQQFSRL